MRTIYRLHYRIKGTLTWAKWEFDAPHDKGALDVGTEHAEKWAAEAWYIEKHAISVLWSEVDA